MSKEINGSIAYKMTISDDGQWNIQYGSESDTSAEAMRNEIAALIIAQHVMENCAIQLMQEKKEAKGKHKQFISQRLSKTIDGRFGLRIIVDHLLDSYPSYMEYLKEKELASLKPVTETDYDITKEE